MPENQKSIKVADLKVYLYSIEEEIANEKKFRINVYEESCKEDEREIIKSNVQKIEKGIDRKYKGRNHTKDKILSFINELESIPEKLEKLQITGYMIYRVDIRRAENIIQKAINRYKELYSNLIEEIKETVEDSPEFCDIGDIDFSEYTITINALDKVKEQYKEEYTDEEREALIKNELDIIEKVKIFNTTPIPHEILKGSDRELQLKMQKFNNARQKRLDIINTMKEDYLKLTEPREIEEMIADALASVEKISNILNESEYHKVKNALLRRKRKVYRSTSEIRNIIKSKEKKTGIISYNLQEARYERMKYLTNIINNASNIIKINDISKITEKLKKLKSSHLKEKQFASVIDKINEDAGALPNENIELRLIEDEIISLENRINNSKKVINEQEEIINQTKKELLVLWKIEIDNTISNKKEKVQLLENEEIREKRKRNSSSGIFSFIFGLTNTQSGKHARI